MKGIKNQKGQALVEFAMIVPILLLLVMGIVQLGMMINSYITIENASREGARSGSVGDTDSEIRNVVISTSPTLDAKYLTVTITPSEASRVSGDTLTVKLTYNYKITIPIISRLFNDVVVLNSQTSMRVEWGGDYMRRLDNKGNVAIILCLLMIGLLGFTAFVVDIGIVYVERIRLTNAIDAAVLAAALELPKGEQSAKKVAEEYLQKNNVDTTQATVTIGADNKSIQIAAHKNVKHFFAQMIGINSSNVQETTKAIIGPGKLVNDGIRPLAVEAYDFPYGELVALKQGAGGGDNGNYGAVALGGQGANVFRINSLYGYSEKISVGDYINTETGNIASVCNDIQDYINSEQSTFDNFSRSSIRLWTIPLVNTLDVNGTKSVQVVGFAKFYVENVTGQSGKIEVSGRFIKYVSNSPIDNSLNDTGFYGVKLSK